MKQCRQRGGVPTGGWHTKNRESTPAAFSCCTSVARTALSRHVEQTYLTTIARPSNPRQRTTPAQAEGSPRQAAYLHVRDAARPPSKARALGVNVVLSLMSALLGGHMLRNSGPTTGNARHSSQDRLCVQAGGGDTEDDAGSTHPWSSSDSTHTSHTALASAK